MKKTKFELDQVTYPDKDFYLKITEIQNNSYERVYSSHLRQLESRKILSEKVFPDGLFIFREELDTLNLNEFDLLVSLGGDNHFTYVAHYAEEIKILGCNSDVVTSRGALLSFNPDTLYEAKSRNWENTSLEEWSMIFARIDYPNGNYLETVSCVNEISIRNMSPDLTSRYIVCYDGLKEEQKCSGLLLYTGAGSTGWYSACLGVSKNTLGDFPKKANEFRVFSRELSRRARKQYRLIDFSVKEPLQVISEMNGGISIDSLPERIYPFPPGSIATFQISPHKLKVVTSLL